MTATSQSTPPVVVLGAGVNGSAIARELVLNRVPVVLVDSGDISRGATAGSSRLIHGGLRYLEYGDAALVRESLRERSRLARLAPQFVRPLELAIPCQHRTGGLLRSAFRFLGSARSPLLHELTSRLAPAGARGRWLVQAGLWLYDRFASDPLFPPHRVTRTQPPSRATSTSSEGPYLDSDRFPWLVRYTDGQMIYPERFTLSLLEDARESARQTGSLFEVLPRHQARLLGSQDELTCTRSGTTRTVPVSAIVNATGAWGDLTLTELGVSSRRLFGGTRGSHLLLDSDELRTAIGDAGIYAEAENGRLVFVLPFGELVLVGTTDIVFSGRPETARCTSDEIAFLLQLLRGLFPAIPLDESVIDSHYSAVRPLPVATAASAGAIPRGHWIERHTGQPVPVWTLVGGKLTTARASAAQLADTVLEALHLRRTVSTTNRPLPGAEHLSARAEAAWPWREQIGRDLRLTDRQIDRMLALCGSRFVSMLDNAEQPHNADTPATAPEILPETDLPRRFVEHVIREEWVETLEDLVERRLMLLYRPGLSIACLDELAGVMVDCGKLEESQRHIAVRQTADRLREQHGKHLRDDGRPERSTPASV